MPMPNALLIGAAKSGTSALYNYLWQHPDVFMSANKEPNFFAFAGEQTSFAGPGDETLNQRTVTDRTVYEALFAGADGRVVRGEASAVYLYHPLAPGRIKSLVPEVKLVALLRNPADRAFSSFLHTRRDGREPLTSFRAALEAEPQRIAQNWGHLWHYRALGFYYAQLQRYLELFPREQLCVNLYEDFVAHPETVVAGIFRFLGIDDQFKPDTSVRFNVSGTAKSPRLQSWLVRPNWIKELLKPVVPARMRKRLVNRAMRLNLSDSKPQLSEADRRFLIDAYRSDILQLQGLLQRDLSSWLTGESME